MTKEILLVRLIQTAIVINSLILCYSIYSVKRGRIGIHQKLNLWVVLSTYLGVGILAITLFLQWDYSGLSTPWRMSIHKLFSVPLFFLLFPTAWLGTRRHPWHKVLARLTLILWAGTTVTGLWFF